MVFYRKKKAVGDRDHIKQVAVLRKNVLAWNEWRAANPEIRYVGIAGAKLRRANLAGANLRGATLIEADLFGADLAGADLMQCDMTEADLRLSNLERTTFDMTRGWRASYFRASFRDADLSGASFTGADCHDADFSGATFGHTSFHEANLEGAVLEGVDLTGTSMSGANLRNTRLAGSRLVNAVLNGALLHGTDLRGADLRGASFDSASLLDTDLTQANLTGARVYGASAWNLRTEGAIQNGLRITPIEEPEITVDDIAMAQFIYLLLNNANLRGVIDTITSKVVLILGRFSEPRKRVLDDIREALRHRNFTPIVFDFQKPSSRDLTETIATLAGMARFVVADITDAKSIPQELMTIVPQFPSVPVVPIVLSSQAEYSMFEHFRRYPWVLSLRAYEETDGGESIVRGVLKAIGETAKE